VVIVFVLDRFGRPAAGDSSSREDLGIRRRVANRGRCVHRQNDCRWTSRRPDRCRTTPERVDASVSGGREQDLGGADWIGRVGSRVGAARG
jgi:hypothetical protein